LAGFDAWLSPRLEPPFGPTDYRLLVPLAFETLVFQPPFLGLTRLPCPLLLLAAPGLHVETPLLPPTLDDRVRQPARDEFRQLVVVEHQLGRSLAQ
jgi:hypothetical protein